MPDTLTPRDGEDVEEAVRFALAAQRPLEIVGAGSKRAIGRPAQTDLTLDLSRLTGVTLYEPEELVLTARAATPIAEIEALVASRGQQLAFEPIDCGPLLGGAAMAGTIGGTLATNLVGPRRIKAGAARDHFLGMTAVSGRGETFKSGGRVVKNVTGYDLCKLIAGSWGTLAALTEVTIKTLPQPETEATVALIGLDDAAAVAAMTAAMTSACDVSGAAHLPAEAAAADPVAASIAGGRAVTLLRLEGVAPSVAHRQAGLAAILRAHGPAHVSAYGPVAIIAAPESPALWRSVRDVLPLSSADRIARPLWRVSTAPARGAELAGAVGNAVDAAVLYDWAGGLIWIAIGEGRDDAGAAVVRQAVARCGGHATLIRASAALRAAVAPFEPGDAGLMVLTRRVKEGFDPAGILNTGRMWAGV